MGHTLPDVLLKNKFKKSSKIIIFSTYNEVTVQCLRQITNSVHVRQSRVLLLQKLLLILQAIRDGLVVVDVLL